MTSGRISVCLRFFPCVERERKDIAIFFYLADFLISWFFLFFAPAGTITSIAGHFADCRLKGKNQRERERERDKHGVPAKKQGTGNHTVSDEMMTGFCAEPLCVL